MNSDEGFSQSEVIDLRRLIEIEEIRKKKQLYSQLIDSLRHDEFAELYAEDAIAEWGQFGRWEGRQAIYDQIRKSFAGRVPYYSLHMTTNLWIELLSPTLATSRAYLHDVNNDPNPRVKPVVYFGVYEEDWAKIGGDWKITRHCVQFLWPERTAAADFPHPMTPTE